MPVNILLDPPAYNKAPEPDKPPSDKLYPTKIIVEQNQLIWVSLPQPDKLHFSVKLTADHFDSSFKPTDLHDYGRMIMQSLASGHVGPVTESTYVKAAHLFTKLQVLFGSAQQPVFFALSRTKNDPNGPHTLTVQLNPRLLTEEGIYELLDRLHKVTEKRLMVGAMLADAKVSRLDVTVDFVGIHVSDVLVRLKREGKRNHRNGVTGELEAIELWLKAIKVCKTDARALILYDKRAERIGAGDVPPHGPAPATRLEVSKKRFGNKPMHLSELGALKNVFANVSMGRVRDAASPLSYRFLRYVDARRSVGPIKAATNLCLTLSDSQKFELWYLSHSSDLLDGPNVWSGWPKGLVKTGTHLLVEAAVKKSPGVPPPDLSEFGVPEC